MIWRNLIPGLFTISNLVCGFIAILIADALYSPLLLILAAFFDVFDGFFARLLKSDQNFGRELDSLADMVSFGVAPAFLYCSIVDFSLTIEIIAGALIIAGSAVRLAYFNLLPPSSIFKGLPTPSNAFFFVGLALSAYWSSEITDYLQTAPILFLFIAIISCIIMNIQMRFFSLKSTKKGLKQNIYLIILIVVSVLIALWNYTVALPLAIVSYVILSIPYHFTFQELPTSSDNK